MSDSYVSSKITDTVFINVSYQTHAFFDLHIAAISSNNTGTFLPTMLQCIQSPISIECNIVFMRINTKNTAFFM